MPRIRTEATFGRVAWLSVLAGTSFAIACFISVAVARWQNNQVSAFDLAFFDQIIWNTAHGRPFEASFIPYNFLGQHAEPILLAFVPFYWLGAGPLFLTVTQNIAAGAAAIPLFAATRRCGLAIPVASAAVIAYLLNGYLHRGLEFDFHPEVMVALPAFSAAWAIAAGRRKTAVALALSTLLFKEDTVFITLALAALMASSNFRREALVTATLAIVYVVLVVLVVMPLARDGQPSDLLQRYGYLVGASDDAGLVKGLLREPWVLPQHLFAAGSLRIIVGFVFMTAPLALLNPRIAAFVVPALMVSVLSSHAPQHALELHYAASLIPILFLAAISAPSGILRASPWPLATAFAAPAIVGFLLISPFGPSHSSATPPTAEHRSAVLAAVSLIPDGARVSAQSNLLARLSHRQAAYEFPLNAETSDWVVVDRYGHRSSQSIDAGFDAELAHLRTEWDVVFERDGVEVLRPRD